MDFESIGRIELSLVMCISEF